MLNSIPRYHSLEKMPLVSLVGTTNSVYSHCQMFFGRQTESPQLKPLVYTRQIQKGAGQKRTKRLVCTCPAGAVSAFPWGWGVRS